MQNLRNDLISVKLKIPVNDKYFQAWKTSTMNCIPKKDFIKNYQH